MAKTKKSVPVMIKITGANQATAINEAFYAKDQATIAANYYAETRKGATEIIMSKVLAYWNKTKELATGAYHFTLPEGVDLEGKPVPACTRVVNIQNRQSTKRYEAKDAKETLATLNENTSPDAPLKMGDVYHVTTTYSVNPEVMITPKIRERVVEVLTALEAELKADRTLAPEISIIQEEKELLLAPHALSRILALSNDFEKAANLLGAPITANLMDK